jgi:hypothetical protein
MGPLDLKHQRTSRGYCPGRRLNWRWSWLVHDKSGESEIPKAEITARGTTAKKML